MHFLKSFYQKNFNYELINKFTYKNTKKLPKIKKIVLNFGCKTTDIKYLTSSLLALELITFQKSKFTTTKSPNILLKIRKGNPVGCKIELRSHKMFLFLETILAEVFPKLKNFDGLKSYKKVKNNTFSFKINDNFAFKPIEKNYYLFNTLPKLDVTIITTTKKTAELSFIIKSLQFPIKSNKHI